MLMDPWVMVTVWPGCNIASSPPGRQGKVIAAEQALAGDGRAAVLRQLDVVGDGEADHRLVGLRIERGAFHAAHLHAGEAHVGAHRQAVDVVELRVELVPAGDAAAGMRDRVGEEPGGDQQHDGADQHLGEDCDGACRRDPLAAGRPGFVVAGGPGTLAALIVVARRTIGRGVPVRLGKCGFCHGVRARRRGSARRWCSAARHAIRPAPRRHPARRHRRPSAASARCRGEACFRYSKYCRRRRCRPDARAAW